MKPSKIIILNNKVQKQETKMDSVVFKRIFCVSQDHAYPADELMPLTCRGRVRGLEPSRGDVDDALGM